jgi:shikimate dehydrogenase
MKRACIVGWPVEHSRSPLIHGYWLKKHSLEGRYEMQSIPPEAAADFLRNLAEHGYIGANVTVPHKETAYVIATNRDAAADTAKAVNLLWIEGGELHGSNTDIFGFLRNLDDQTPGWDKTGMPAAVLGAGGAARGVLLGLLDRGFSEVRLINRTRERAEILAAKSDAAHIFVYDWENRVKAIERCALLVNTTTQGMKGNPPLDIDLSGLARDAVVNDIVYVPLETDLLARARQHGFRIADGLGMLLHQAVPAFEKWFGERPEVTADLRALVIADLEAHA